MRHRRHKSKGMKHQPGYLEAQAVRILAHAEQYVRREYGPTIAWAVLSTAYYEAVAEWRIAIQQIPED